MQFRPKLPLPPSASDSTALYDWLVGLTAFINSRPTVSWFSGTSPNSAITGVAGDMAINVGSASTSTRLWIKGGAAGDAPSQTGWNMVRIAT